jgi:hypothetical protein
VNQLGKEALAIKFHPYNGNREEGLKLSKAWNPNATLSGHSNTQRSGKSQENNGKSMLKKTR